MNLELLEKLAATLLYEGYLLYPYRPSTVKNRHRFNFGLLVPEIGVMAQAGSERSGMQTECLVLGDRQTVIDLKVRFLHLLSREAGRLSSPGLEQQDGESPKFTIVESLEVDNQLFQTCQEATERQISAPRLNLGELIIESQRFTFAFPPKNEIERLYDSTGQVAGVICRKQRSIEGAVEIAAEQAGDQLYKITARVLNLTLPENMNEQNREENLMRSLVSVHTILGVLDGEFVSLLDPPEALREAAASCNNVGTWPVLVGEEGEKDLMLSSPIILYDYPKIAPESAGDLFDGTEIDEILTLRIMTLTDEEKREMRFADERSRKILERTETLPMEQLMKLHGTVRGLRPLKEQK
jgi:hypothetical protein